MVITASKVFKTAFTILMITVLFRTASNQTKLYIEYSIRCYLLNIEALTVLGSVVKHAGSS